MARAKQNQLPEMADVRNEKLSKFALAYTDVRDRRINLNKDETAAKTILMHEMKQAGLDRYEDLESDILVVLDQKENVKVSKPSEADEDDA